jgi:type IX secretion system PorP/SprF family membrane protein
MRKIFSTCLVLSAALVIRAQDPNFSQFFVSPLTLNPALTGKFDGVLRVAGNYRMQWPTIYKAYNTGTVSVDGGILKGRIPENDQFGIGILALSDKSGEGGILQDNYVALSMAYHKALDENGFHQLGLGFQGAYTDKKLYPYKAHFEDQLTANGWTGITSEVFDNKDELSTSYFDMNLGLFYSGTTDGFNNFYFGSSVYHVNRHKESFHGANYLLDPRLTFQAGGIIPLANNNAIHISAMHSRQANSVNTLIGGAYMLSLNADPMNETNLYVGSWFRFGDAIIPYVGLEFGDFRLGATYDVNVSSLKPGSNMRGGAEFSLIYIKKPSDPNAKRLNCPKF